MQVQLARDATSDICEKDPTLLHGVPVWFDPADAEMVGSLEKGAHSTWEAYQVHGAAERLSLCPGFDQLLSLPLVREVTPYPHQLATVKTVLQQLRGRAMLCDEVGLGKTIEAGFVLLELALRGLARKVLILTPPSLVEQWRQELSRKFGLAFTTPADPPFLEQGASAWREVDRVVASLTLARRPEHAQEIHAQRYDLVIVDEAHHVRNRGTVGWRFVNALQRRYTLLLTATPVHNNLEELYNLITLIAPGQLHTLRSFRREHVSREDKLSPRDPVRLRDLVGEVMIRNRRSACGVAFTRRYARTLAVPLGPPEQELYGQVSRFVRSHFSQGGPFHRMALQTLQMEMGSSPQATVGTLEKMAAAEGLAPALAGELRSLCKQAASLGTSAKEEVLVDLLRKTPEKAIVFTRFRATLERLSARLGEEGIPAAVFHGGMPRREREAGLQAFERELPVLLSSDAGSEGRNLQFCNTLVNYDLPWNPMKIEQRIGRVSRLGQTRNVFVFNLVSPETLEGELLQLLDSKLRMFELVVGEMDMILGEVSEDREFDNLLMDLWVSSSTWEEFSLRLEELGEQMLTAKRDYLRVRSANDVLFENTAAQAQGRT